MRLGYMLDKVNGGVTRAAAIVTIIAALAGGFAWVDSRYARSAVVQQNFQRVSDSISQLHCRIIRHQLNELDAKEEFKQLNEYDNVNKEELNRAWKANCVGGTDG